MGANVLVVVVVCVLCGHNSGEKNRLLIETDSGDEEVDEEKCGPFCPRAGYQEYYDDKGHSTQVCQKDTMQDLQDDLPRCGVPSQVGTITNYVKKITEKPDEHKPFMNAFRAWLQKKAAEPSAAWTDLMNAAKEAATTVDEQKPQACNSSSETRLWSSRPLRSITKATKSTRRGSTKRCPLPPKGQSMGYWMKGIFNEHLEGHYLFQHL